MIRYVKGDATEPTANGAKVIVHVCNDVGGWGKGFVMAISKRWPQPEAAYRAWFKQRATNDFALGAVQFVQVADGLWVASLVGQRDLRAENGVPPIRYEAIRAGLQKVAAFAVEQRASVHMPRIGCGLAGGKWEQIEPIIERELGERGVEVDVYDLA
ncbi:MAG: macro domain-containing protein [Deltaproteobacteria bacterium]|nr:macro domain-containing protein [Deltaproteobacteria bacterium]